MRKTRTLAIVGFALTTICGCLQQGKAQSHFAKPRVALTQFTWTSKTTSRPATLSWTRVAGNTETNCAMYYSDPPHVTCNGVRMEVPADLADHILMGEVLAIQAHLHSITEAVIGNIRSLRAAQDH